MSKTGKANLVEEPCSSGRNFRSSRGTYCLHVQGRSENDQNKYIKVTNNELRTSPNSSHIRLKQQYPVKYKQ
jgi:hypothetical protein